MKDLSVPGIGGSTAAIVLCRRGFAVGPDPDLDLNADGAVFCDAGPTFQDAADMESFFARAADMHLNGAMECIRVPFLVTHCVRDWHIALDYAHQSYAQLVNAPVRELKIFPDREERIEHVGADNMPYASGYIVDWLAEQLDGRAV